MKNRWSDADASAFVKQQATTHGRDLALRVYADNLIGIEPSLVLHGGGNTSVKTTISDITGDRLPALFIKPTGGALGKIAPGDYVCLDQNYLLRLQSVPSLTNETMAELFRLHQLRPSQAMPSVEALVHAFIPHMYVDHTHPESILVLTNTAGAESLVREALGEGVVVLPYEKAGVDLGRQIHRIMQDQPSCKALVLRHHGLITWGKTARESYENTIRLVSRAEKFLKGRTTGKGERQSAAYRALARERYETCAPLIRGRLASAGGHGDDPWSRVILRPLITDEALSFVDSREGKRLALAGPITPDHIVRTGAMPLWIDRPDFQDPENFKTGFSRALDAYTREYDAYARRHGAQPQGTGKLPAVIFIPGLGVICSGRDARQAGIARDITEQTIRAKLQAVRAGLTFRAPTEKSIFGMEFHLFQRAKVARNCSGPGEGKVALITGAAGAIGTGIAESLLDAGFHVALTDLPGEGLNAAVARFLPVFDQRVIGVAMDVTSEESVARGVRDIIAHWGGVDLLIANAGIAHVAALTELDPATFRKLQQVNVEGTLLVIAEAARQFRAQGTGGDIVLVSTKNVFAPGARFGAYSATKAAAHQLARIASLELADIDVRVNMVAPDAVFSHGATRSGLWATVGPDRMKARGLDEKGLEEYYRGRNLLKARVTAQHVGRAVLFFATRQTPTTGATIPVDGGLPDAAPR